MVRDGLLGVAIVLIPLGMNLVLQPELKWVSVAILALGVVALGFRAWLKTRVDK